MGIIIKKSIWGTVLTYLSFIIGFFFSIQLMPQLMSKEEMGLVNVFYDIASPIVSLSMFGMYTILTRFFPYYEDRLEKKDNDLLSLTWWVSIIGFTIIMGGAFLFKETLLNQFLKKAPLLQHYYYLLPIFSIGVLHHTILQGFHIALKNTIFLTVINEIYMKSYNAVLLILLLLKVIDFDGFIKLYSLMFIISTLILAYQMRQEGYSLIKFRFSTLTKRFKKHFIHLASYLGFGGFFGVLSLFVDTFTLMGVQGLSDTGIFTYTNKFLALMLVAYKAVSPIATSVLATAWKNNDSQNIEDIYKKSALNLFLIGGFIFIGISSNLQTYIKNFLPTGYNDVYLTFLILGVAKMIDFMTGVNSEIIGMSKKYWKNMFYGSILLIVLMIPFNYYFISNYGTLGAAWANLLVYIIYNAYKTAYLYYKANLYPFSKELGLSVILVTTLLIGFNNFDFLFQWSTNYKITTIINMVLKGALLTVIYMPLIYGLKLSTDINRLLDMAYSKLKQFI